LPIGQFGTEKAFRIIYIGCRDADASENHRGIFSNRAKLKLLTMPMIFKRQSRTQLAAR
jgi:hypothetical protein